MMRADAQRNHEKILAAAEEIFALDGVTVPIESITERAGVGIGIGTLYRHFPTKESLYEAIVVARLSGLVERADDYRRRRLYPGDALDAFLRDFARQAAEKQDLFEALDQAGFDFKSRFADLVDELNHHVEALRLRAVNAGSLRDDVDSGDIINLIIDTCHAAGHSGADGEDVQRLVSAVIAGLQPLARR